MTVANDIENNKRGEPANISYRSSDSFSQFNQILENKLYNNGFKLYSE